MTDTGVATAFDAVRVVVGRGEDFQPVGARYTIPLSCKPFLVNPLLDEALHGCTSAGIDIDETKRAIHIPGDGQNVNVELRCKSGARSYHRDLELAQHHNRKAPRSSIDEIVFDGGFYCMYRFANPP